MKTLKSVSYLLSFTIPLAKSLQYASHGGFSPFERIENVTGIEALFTARHSGQMRQIIQTLVCGENQENCAHSAGKFYKALKNYGCNCYPDNYIKTDLDTTGTFSHMGANGASLDWIDRACLRVHDAYKCMIQDYNSGIILQTTENGCYPGIGFVYHTDSNGDIVCGTEDNVDYAANDNNGCRLAACQIERNFAYAVRTVLTDPVTFFQENKNTMYGNNEDPSVCMKSGNPVNRDQCCGEFPVRRPFFELTHDCCPEGNVKLFGEC